MVKCCCLWIIEKFTIIHQQNNNVKINNYGFSGWPHWKRMTYDTFWWTQITHMWPMMLCLYGKRCILEKNNIFLPLRTISLFHFKAFFFVRFQQKALKVTKYANKTHVLRGKVCMTVDSWGYLLVFVFIFNNGIGCVMKTTDFFDSWKMIPHHPSYILSLTSDL